MTADTPLTVHQALVAVMGALPAIGRDGRASKEQGGYPYRGIEQITREVQGLFAEHGVVVVPQVTDMEIRSVTVGGKPWSDTILHVTYVLTGPDGSTVEARTVGIGRDGSDKGANKAMTQAFKYLLLQVLCVADTKDDADGSTHEAEYVDSRIAYDERVSQVLDELGKLNDEQQAAITEWKGQKSLSGKALHAEPWLQQVEAWLDEHAPEPVTEGATQ